MMFDEFEEYRIANFLVFTNQVNSENVDLSKIQAKYSESAGKKGQKIN